MNKNFVVLDPIDIQISPDAVLIQSGYPDAGSASEGMRKKVCAVIKGVKGVIEPRGGYLLLDEADYEGFDLYAGAERIVLALATIGESVGKISNRLIKDGLGATGFIVDAAGTIAVEQTADLVEQRIHEDFGKAGYKVSRRYAPGYCGWALEAQKEILGRFPDTLGVNLTKSCLMIPEKSLTFLCGLSHNDDFSSIKVGDCKKCRQKDCPYRKEPFNTNN